MIIPIEEKNYGYNKSHPTCFWSIEDTFIPNDFWSICEFNPHEFYDSLAGIPKGYHQFVDDIIAICITLKKFDTNLTIPLSVYMEKRKIEDREKAAKEIILNAIVIRNMQMSYIPDDFLCFNYTSFFADIFVSERTNYNLRITFNEFFHDHFKYMRSVYKEKTKKVKK